MSRHGVTAIVDVRSVPYSQHAPDFAKQELEEAAASAGLGYRWMGHKLGGKPPASAEDLASALDELAGLATSTSVALLCAELDPTHCHRDSVLAPALVARGYDVMHILADGGAAPYQDHLDLGDAPT